MRWVERLQLLKPEASNTFINSWKLITLQLLLDIDINNALDSPGQYCVYCTSYLSSGNLVRHLDTCARFDGRFSADMSKVALKSEQKHKVNYTKKYVLSGSEVNKLQVNLSATN